MNLSDEDILKLASLAKLRITKEDIASYRKELSDILGYVKRLDSVNLDGLNPTEQVTGLTNAMRKDKIVDMGVDRNDLLSNTPFVQDGNIKVKRVL